jgi:predicted nucleotide-binding protein
VLDQENRRADRQAAGRENLVFELGYLIGKLGRDRVFAVVTNGTRLPTDFAGVTFIGVDMSDPRGVERVEAHLRRELQAAGLTVE